MTCALDVRDKGWDERAGVFENLRKLYLVPEIELGAFVLTPLTPDATEEDYSAVISSEQSLVGLFEDDWPVGLTLEKNTLDLERHAREFRDSVSFSWIVRSESGAYVGCLYVTPLDPDAPSAKVVLWVVDRPDRKQVLQVLSREIVGFLKRQTTSSLRLDWRDNAEPEMLG